MQYLGDNLGIFAISRAASTFRVNFVGGGYRYHPTQNHIWIGMLWTKNVEGQQFAHAIVFRATNIGEGCKSSMSTRHQSLKCDIQRPCYNLDL